MSRIFSKLEQLPTASAPLGGPVNADIKNIHSSVVISLITVTALVSLFFLGSLCSNLATIKNSIFISMDAKIQQQQNQIILLTKKVSALQSSVDDRIHQDEAATFRLNKSVQTKLADINDDVNSKIDRTSVNMDHMEAVLQANIDTLNAKLNKMQMPPIPVSPGTGGQT